MQKILAYIGIVFFGFLWFLGCSKTTTNLLFDAKVLKDDFRYGDLYRLSNLARFKDLQQKCSPVAVKPKNINLIIAGDSFTEKERIDSASFGSKTYQRLTLAEPETILSVKKGSKNVLILEVVERHFRERFAKPYTALRIKKEKALSPSLKQKALNFMLPYSENQHQAALFGFDFILNLKELKASINEQIFHRVDPKVVLSADKESIFYYLDSEAGATSGYEPISEAEIFRLVYNMNLSYAHYKSLGFEEIYLSIIPNKSSILEPGKTTYNHLIERIEQHESLQMPVLSIFQAFKKLGKPAYELGDSHWSCTGQNIWLNTVNHKLDGLK
jgi:hypothetical protein